MAKASPEYLTKVKLLSKDETERLLSRMGNKLDRRLEKHKVSREEALASQLELEDEQLLQWRKTMLELKKKEAEKSQAKPQAKTKETSESKSKTKATVKTKAAVKTKAVVKPKSSAPKAPSKTATKSGK